MKKRAWLLHLSVFVLIVVGCSRSLGVVDGLVAEAETITPPESTELMRYERDSIEVFAGPNQSGGVGVVWASDRSFEELTSYYESHPALSGGKVIDRAGWRVDYDATTADGLTWLSVTVYRQVPERWPSFDTPEIDVPPDKTIVLVTSNYTQD